MRFNQINIPRQVASLRGLKEINLDNCGPVVALIGKNGSGKSRILDSLEENLLASTSLTAFFDGSISFWPKQCDTIMAQALPFKGYFEQQKRLQEVQVKLQQDQGDPTLQNELRTISTWLRNFVTRPDAQNQINGIANQWSKLRPELRMRFVRRIKPQEIRNLKQGLADNKNQPVLPFETLVENIKSGAGNNELTAIYGSALNYLAKLPHKLASDKFDSLIKNTNFEEKASYKKFSSLKSFIELFLKKSFTWEQQSNEGSLTEAGQVVTYTGHWKINGRPFNYNEFSDGEKTLFAYALLFFLIDQNPNLDIRKCTLIIDEPEIHLHPDSEIELIERLREVVHKEGQLIFATHSINILSHLNYNEIFIVKDSSIQARNHLTQKNSLNELMHIENRVTRLSDFLASLESWSYSNFMVECFSGPDVIETSPKDDPQGLALKQAISSHLNKDSAFLLDFGAGKGRMLEQLRINFPFFDQISYSALEPEKDFHPRLKELGAQETYASYLDVPANKFNFVLLCNVLHEISLDRWILTLNQIILSIKEGGYLIIVEAKKLSKGEKIGEIGFLLLGLEEIQKLFNLRDAPLSIVDPSNKINCAVLPRNKLSTIDKENLIACMRCLIDNTLNKIEVLRKDGLSAENSARYGRQSAFLSQQYVNATLALRKLNLPDQSMIGSNIEPVQDKSKSI